MTFFAKLAAKVLKRPLNEVDPVLANMVNNPPAGSVNFSIGNNYAVPSSETVRGPI